MTANSSTNNPPPYSADTSLCIFLDNGGGQLLPDHPFYQLVDETRQGFLSSGDTLEYMANSTFVDNPTSQSQLARVDEIRGLLRYNCPVIVSSKSAAIGGGLPHDGPNIIEKVAGRKHIYLDQDMIDHLLKFLLKLILLRELTIASWLTYGIQKSDAVRGNERSSTPFTQPTDVFVSGAKCRDLWSVLFLNDEGGYLEVPAFDTPILRKLASGDWSVFQRDVITSMGPYRGRTLALNAVLARGTGIVRISATPRRTDHLADLNTPGFRVSVRRKIVMGMQTG
ncbi:hypothetical protein DFJ58DRAFT_913422 [Suillus subalutaceus]|uniref:uncharacterized protein n=1 Tax=Suillus subalutaceus TaxID=48586 RepID=UPI001B8800E4|nr:uncharacterized protein DFJ58DRAFT_913422 [Suillus subalutaceus]KAG1857698.1 hypothetical protein DFJ58DRAFT_913422 [Suillus subalutaceus]